MGPQNTAQFIKHQEPPPAWVEQLATVSRPNDDVPYLVLWWRAGMWYEPIQRWVLYEILPPNWFDKIITREQLREGESLTAEILKDLKGPDPSTVGHWYSDPRVTGGKRWFSDSLVDRDQWRLYRRVGGIPLLYWIIQGEKGGHKRVLSTSEVKLLEATGHKRPDVPDAGALPFAPFDNRVVEKIGERDKLKQWDQQFGRGFESRIADKHTAGMIVQQEAEAAKLVARQALGKWLESQLTSVADELAHFIDMADVPVRPAPRDEDAVEQRFLED